MVRDLCKSYGGQQYQYLINQEHFVHDYWIHAIQQLFFLVALKLSNEWVKSSGHANCVKAFKLNESPHAKESKGHIVSYMQCT